MVGNGVVKRLDAEAVARQQQFLAGTIPQSEGEHSPEPMHARLACILI